MAFTYDTTTDRGRVRLLLADTNTGDATLQIFDDDEIDAFLVMSSNEVLLAAAMGAESIASNEIYIQKVQKTLDVQTDGAAVAREWRFKAKQWRDWWEEGGGDPSGLFDWAEMVDTDFAARERVIKESLRS